MDNGISESDGLDKLKILNDIYRKENEHLKHEYRVLHDKWEITDNRYKELNDKYMILQNQLNDSKSNYEILYNDFQQIQQKYENTLGVKLTRKLKNSFLYKWLIKIKKY